MPNCRSLLVATFGCLILLTGPANGLADDWSKPLKQLQPFLTKHCVDCHQGKDADGGLDLTKLSTDLNQAEPMRRWVLLHDRLATGEMPPKDAEQPTKKEVSHALATLAGTLTAAHRPQGQVVLRRLNRNEYQNTVRDLFDIDITVKELLPKDTPTDGFDNVGEGLAVSAEAAAAYLKAADRVLDAAFGPVKKPKYIKHETNLLKQVDWKGRPQLAGQFGKMFRKTKDGVVIFQSGYCPTNLVNFARLRPPVGTYRGKFKVRAIQSKDPVTLRIYGGDTIVGRREKHLVGYYDIPPNKWTTVEFTDKLVEAGGTYKPMCYNTRDTRKNADTYPHPGIEIGDIVIEGPLEQWPPPSREKLLGNVDLKKGTLEDAKTIVAKLLPRAFRRPLQPGDVEPYENLMKSALDKGRSFEDALRLGLKAVLCSPEFLYLDEPGRDKVSQYALASRLSYFLWSSMPDDTLFELAKNKKLDQKTVLIQQVDRMLKDPKSEAFVGNFTGQWLDLRDIDFTQPDENLYPEFDELLRLSMLKETRLFFKELLSNNLSLMNFVDSDFTFLNERLAKHYGMTDIIGQEFRKVTLPSDSVRGGVLTHASVLKVTANGTNTSPVLRGVWVMENILGQKVPPPPSNVPAVEPDIRGATTLRELLAKHRSVQSCAACHQKIDPPGFALESFDVIGGFRDRYRTLGEGKRPGFKQSPFTRRWVKYRIGLPVDATGQTAGGKSFQNINDFKKIILNDKHAVAHGLAEKLSTYALGRRMGFSDRAALEVMVKNTEKKNFGFRTLVDQVVLSDLFRRP